MRQYNDDKTTALDDNRRLTPEAERALAEASERRKAAKDQDDAVRTKEIDGRGGAEPVRFGDWEVKGIATDF